MDVDLKEKNSLEFKNFKLHSDSTLLNLKKQELISYIHMLYHNWCACDETRMNIQKYAEQLSGIKPYKLEELKPITPTNIVLKHKQSNTLLEVMGLYDIIGFFPNCKGMNMVIVLKEREMIDNGKY